MKLETNQFLHLIYLGDGKTVKTDGTHVVIHEYLGNGPENSLFIGDRINIVCL